MPNTESERLERVIAYVEEIINAQDTHKRPKKHFTGCEEYHAGCLARIIRTMGMKR